MHILQKKSIAELTSARLASHNPLQRIGVLILSPDWWIGVLALRSDVKFYVLKERTTFISKPD